ncbi:MBL fold metallo-hydrolase [Arsenicicoccus sp. oral taxon 190]|uniref:MBL fold metallo-hydrolase n=1 Tax=Arsenicicoccus sp. oral taxon 190 TaxID=1658671 RepID=UPI00067A0E0D|nr:MBL fold metallo-hydrolase [Arsenicicoccus sp. oral taxon 190]AKT52118.1 Zn-dependent hydrolase [Arsenicicoccus sp. oral taxon 190]
MRLTHLGHACLLVEMADSRILLDPGTLAADWEELRDLDAVVVTHQHPDHLDPDRLPALRAANPDAAFYVEAEAREVVDVPGAETFASGAQLQVGEVTLRGVGEQHAVINEFIPRIRNTGAVLSAEGEPTVFHPGDAYDADPGPVDVLAFPLNAPWCASKETIAFLRRIAPRVAVPIHDGLLAPAGRQVYLGHASSFSPEQTEVRDLAGAGAREITL